MRRFNIARLLAVGTATFIGATFINVGAAHADVLPVDTVAPGVSISASCFDQANSLAYWSVNNPSEESVSVGWTADDGDESGTYAATTGTTQLTTPYDDDEPMESFIFSQAGQDDITLSVPGTACEAPVQAPCVDGTIPSNLVFDFSPLGLVTIHTVDGDLLCDDVTLYLSSYTLPADYDNTGIFDDSAVPQQLFDSASVVLHKGTAGGETVEVNIPDACTDYQLDLYYAPEITIVTGEGHGSQLLFGRIYLGGATDCSGEPGKGGGDQTPPPAETPPVVEATAPTPVVATPVATTLTNTGTQTWLTTTIAIVLLGAAIAVNGFARFSRNKNL